mgnify:CR=1 FL=1
MGPSVFRVEALQGIDKPREVTFSLRRGEVLGFFGLVGAGRTETLRAAFGLDALRSGTVRLGDLDISAHTPRERWEAMRDARVRSIVRHAAATVPHYRDLFRRERIDPDEIRSAADLDRLPLLDKGTIWRAPERFLSESYTTRNTLPLITSGSTGRPLTGYHDRTSLIANIAFGERERAVVRELAGQGARREVLLLYAGSTFGKVLDFYDQATFIPIRPTRSFISIGDPIERVVGAINHFRPDVVIGMRLAEQDLNRPPATRPGS